MLSRRPVNGLGNLGVELSDDARREVTLASSSSMRSRMRPRPYCGDGAPPDKIDNTTKILPQVPSGPLARVVGAANSNGLFFTPQIS